MEYVHGGDFLFSDEVAGYTGECEFLSVAEGDNMEREEMLTYGVCQTNELRHRRLCACVDVFDWVLVYAWKALLYRSGDACEDAFGDYG